MFNFYNDLALTKLCGDLRCTATIVDTRGEDPRSSSNQGCTATGALTKKRMETVDEQFSAPPFH